MTVSAATEINVFADFLHDAYSDHFPCACDTGELTATDRRTFEAAYVAYWFGDSYFRKLAEQTSPEWQQTDFGKVGQEIEAEIGVNPFARRKRGRPVQQRDRLLIRAVKEECNRQEIKVKLPASDPIDNSDIPTEFSRECERFIRIVDPTRNRMPGRKTYEAAFPQN